MKITLEKDKRWRGCYFVMVDGARWADIRMEGHGVHGVSYEFYLPDGGPITEADHAHARAARVRSDKGYRREHGISKYGENSAVPPLESRLIEKATTIINAGRLQSPAQREAARLEANAKYRAQCEREKRDRRRKWEIKAREIILNWKQDSEIDLPDTADAALVVGIADALDAASYSVD